MSSTARPAPASDEELHAWPDWFCRRLWATPECGADYKQNFADLYNHYDICVYDSYAGSGNGSVSLKKQMNACVRGAGSSDSFLP